MNREWLPAAMLRAASLIAPGVQRAEWFREWRTELFYVPRNEAVQFCLGAFQDAAWLRRNRETTESGLLHPVSPMRCLATMAVLSAVSLLAASLLPARDLAPYWQLRMRDLLTGCVVMLPMSSLVLLAARLAMGGPAGPAVVSWRSRNRSGLYFLLKVILAQPLMLCGMVLMLRAGTAPLAPLSVGASWILLFRWILLDQRRRCPVCLRPLTHPVRIGTPSETFLEWYGAESMCERGHGLMHVPEAETSFGKREWLKLDSSWSGLFAGATEEKLR